MIRTMRSGFSSVNWISSHHLSRFKAYLKQSTTIFLTPIACHCWTHIWSVTTRIPFLWESTQCSCCFYLDWIFNAAQLKCIVVVSTSHVSKKEVQCFAYFYQWASIRQFYEHAGNSVLKSYLSCHFIPSRVGTYTLCLIFELDAFCQKLGDPVLRPFLQVTLNLLSSPLLFFYLRMVRELICSLRVCSSCRMWYSLVLLWRL